MPENQHPHAHDQRICYSLIQRVGAWNRYQFYLFIVLTGISSIEVSLIFIAPYLYRTSAYQCPDLEGDLCHDYVCSLPYTDRRMYRQQSPFRSLIDGIDLDFNCQYSSVLTLLSTMVFVSSVTGMFLFTTVSQKFGRKTSTTFTMILVFLGLSVTLLGGLLKQIPIVICGIMITYWGTQNSYQLLMCFATEVVAEQHRIVYINLINVVYGVGMATNAIAFYFIKDWMKIIVFVHMIPTLIVISAVYFFVEDTPMDILRFDKSQDVLLSLQRVANFNRVTLSITIEEIDSLKHRLFLSFKSSKKGFYNICDFFTFQSLRNTVFPLMIYSFIVTYLFFSPSVIKNPLGDDLFQSSMIESASYVTSIALASPLLQNTKRRTSSFLLSSLLLVFSCLLLKQSQNPGSIMHMIYYFVYRLLVSCSYCCLYVINYEMFPTQIRSVGSTICSITGNFSGICQPQVIALCTYLGVNSIWQFVALSLISFLPIYFLKETYEIPPPEIIEELIEEEDDLGVQE